MKYLSMTFYFEQAIKANYLVLVIPELRTWVNVLLSQYYLLHHNEMKEIKSELQGGGI